MKIDDLITELSKLKTQQGVTEVTIHRYPSKVNDIYGFLNCKDKDSRLKQKIRILRG